jgi:dTMP kinase
MVSSIGSGFMFLVLEGIDGAGKTTHAKMLHEYFRSKRQKCVLTDEPTSGTIGIIIKGFLRQKSGISPNALQLLFASDRAEHVEKFIVPELKSGTNIIMDRYVASTVAYGTASGLDKEWLISINSKFRTPDITLLLDIDPKASMKRKFPNQDESEVELFESVSLLEKVRNTYLELAKVYDNYFIIDASKSKDAVEQAILNKIEHLL